MAFITLSAPYLFSSMNYNDPDKVIGILEKGIHTAQLNGQYRCCLSPPCKMCYLGNWKFDKGTCYCDDAILEGRYEDVCPECAIGLENNTCSSSLSLIP